MIDTALSDGPFDAGVALAPLDRLGAGAVASFAGIARADDGVTALVLEHYPGMTEAALARLAGEAMARFALSGVVIRHRIGAVPVGERIMIAAAAARHRHAALDACAFLIDRLKTGAPFWKRELLADGTTRWVEPRAGDDQAAARWD
jgi:molybdopterin synthase catalytic subunit